MISLRTRCDTDELLFPGRRSHIASSVGRRSKIQCFPRRGIRRLYTCSQLIVDPGEVLPYIGYIVMCDPKGYGFLAILLRNRVSILAILASNGVWFLYCSLELGMFS